MSCVGFLSQVKKGYRNGQTEKEKGVVGRNKSFVRPSGPAEGASENKNRR